MAKPGPKPRPIKDRFLEQMSPEPNTGCWLWHGATAGNDYGVIGVTGKERRLDYAHRVSHELFNGPIPAGHEIDHLCRVHCCVNPDHLEAVTRSVNQRRGGDARGPKHQCVNGHRLTPENIIIENKKNGRSVRRCRTCRTQQLKRYRRA